MKGLHIKIVYANDLPVKPGLLHTLTLLRPLSHYEICLSHHLDVSIWDNSLLLFLCILYCVVNTVTVATRRSQALVCCLTFPELLIVKKLRLPDISVFFIAAVYLYMRPAQCFLSTVRAYKFYILLTSTCLFMLLFGLVAARHLLLFINILGNETWKLFHFY